MYYCCDILLKKNKKKFRELLSRIIIFNFLFLTRCFRKKEYDTLISSNLNLFGWSNFSQKEVISLTKLLFWRKSLGHFLSHSYKKFSILARGSLLFSLCHSFNTKLSKS
jgi:hypothetical protein